LGLGFELGSLRVGVRVRFVVRVRVKVRLGLGLTVRVRVEEMLGCRVFDCQVE
jgi:hypothetical protein